MKTLYGIAWLAAFTQVNVNAIAAGTVAATGPQTKNPNRNYE